MNVDDLKRLAGITGSAGYSEVQFEDPYQVAADNRAREKNDNIQPGTKEWMDMWFGNANPYNNPVQFRGRKRK
jgi:hypothetical protein